MHTSVSQSAQIVSTVVFLRIMHAPVLEVDVKVAMLKDLEDQVLVILSSCSQQSLV